MLSRSARRVRGALLALGAPLLGMVLLAPVTAVPAGQATASSVSIGPATVSRPATVTVRVSRGEIVSLHFITDGTVSSDEWTVVGRTASGSMTWHSIGSRVVTVEVALATGRVLRTSVSVTVEGPAAADPTAPRFQLVYLYPSDAPLDPGRAEGIVHEAQVVDEWFAEQTGGLSPRFALDLRGRPSLIRLSSRLTSKELSESDDVAAAIVNRWRVEGTVSRATVPIVYIEGRQRHLEKACGWYESPLEFIVLPIDNCGLAPAPLTEFPYRSTAVLAHEIVHALGAMSLPDEADHAGGHTTDDPRDLMYDGSEQHDWENLALDPNHDDYYLTGEGEDGDISSNDLLERD